MSAVCHTIYIVRRPDTNWLNSLCSSGSIPLVVVFRCVRTANSFRHPVAFQWWLCDMCAVQKARTIVGSNGIYSILSTYPPMHGRMWCGARTVDVNRYKRTSDIRLEIKPISPFMWRLSLSSGVRVSSASSSRNRYRSPRTSGLAYFGACPLPVVLKHKHTQHIAFTGCHC